MSQTNTPLKVSKTDAEWREQLSEFEYQVTRKKGTERAFSGEYWDTKVAGTYHCRCCGEALFASETKFDSGTGWPSFWAPVAPTSIALHEDKTFGMMRTEVTCGSCGAHLGHVFPDGPKPTGMRYCMNSISLKLAPADK